MPRLAAVPLAAAALAVAAAGASARPAAHAGAFDPAFAAGGRTAFTVGTGGARVSGIALRPDGRAVVAGVAATADGGSATSVAVVDAFGALGGVALVDPVATGGAAPAGLALAPDGAAIVATTVTSPRTGRRAVHVLRVRPDGTLDRGFGDDGVAVLDFENGNVRGEDVALDGQGRILVAASTERDGRRYMSAFRLLGDGTRDPRFAGGRVDLDSRAFAGAILPRPGGGAFLAGGTLRRYGNAVVVAVNDRGVRLDRFAGGRANVRLADRTRPGTGARDMVAGPDGTLVIAARVRARGARERLAVLRLTRRGRLDPRFAAGGIFAAGTPARPLRVQRIARDGRGRLLLAGSARTPGGGERALVLRLTRRGRADARFGAGGAIVRRLGRAPGERFVDSRATGVVAGGHRVWVAGIALDDVVDPVTDTGRAWSAVMRLLG